MQDIENNIYEDQQTTKPQSSTEPFVPGETKTNWPVIVLGTFGVIIILGVVGYAAYSYGRSDQQIQPTPTPVATPTTQPLPTTPATPTPDPTAGWKTYKSDTYNIQLKYPTTWFVDETALAQGIRMVSLGTFDTSIAVMNITSDVQVQVFIDRKPEPFYDVDQENYTNFGNSIATGVFSKNGYKYKIEQVTIGGQRAIKYTTLERPQGIEVIYDTIILVQRNEDEFIRIQYHAISKDVFNQQIEIFDQILSTFKFTEDVTADWDTFQSDKFGYKIKFPAEVTSGDSPTGAPSNYDDISFYLVGPAQGDDTSFNDGLKINIRSEENPQQLSLKDYVIDSASSGYPTITDIDDNFSVGEITAVRVIGYGIAPFDEIVMPYNGNAKLIIIQASYIGENVDYYKEIYNAMLSTFKFID